MLAIAGPNGNTPSLVIVLAIAVAVTSIPVIARMFADLKILHTRFARLVLGVAVIEDIALWAALAVATALAGSTELDLLSLVKHVGATIAFFALGLTMLPKLLRHVNKARWNILAQQHSPIAYVFGVLLAYCALAGALGVSLVFAAFLAGFAVVHKKEQIFPEPMSVVDKMGFSVFIPIYFAIVGYRLDLSGSVPLALFALFLVGSCVVKLASVSLAARLAGFRGFDMINIAVATNARGGPGIVLASVAYDAGIHQFSLLHDPGFGSRPDVASDRSVARIRAAQGLAAAFRRASKVQHGCSDRDRAHTHIWGELVSSWILEQM